MSQLGELKDKHYDQNMKFQSHKANVEALKYLVESENAHANHGPSSQDEYNAALEKLDLLRLAREDTEIEIGLLESQIKDIKSIVKKKQDDLDKYTKQYTLTENKLGKLDRSRMSMANKLGDIVRDLPILDFLDPYYKVNQIVVADVKYDVNFAAVPVVDRCTSCHLGIDNPDFSDAPQPYTTHPNLDLYVTSNSPHPMNNFVYKLPWWQERGTSLFRHPTRLIHLRIRRDGKKNTIGKLTTTGSRQCYPLNTLKPAVLNVITIQVILRVEKN